MDTCIYTRARASIHPLIGVQVCTCTWAAWYEHRMGVHEYHHRTEASIAVSRMIINRICRYICMYCSYFLLIYDLQPIIDGYSLVLRARIRGLVSARVHCVLLELGHLPQALLLHPHANCVSIVSL